MQRNLNGFWRRELAAACSSSVKLSACCFDNYKNIKGVKSIEGVGRGDRDRERMIRDRAFINLLLRELLGVMAPDPNAAVLPLTVAGARRYFQHSDATSYIWRSICSALQ